MKKLDLKVFTTNLKTQINTKKPTVRNKYKEEAIKIRKENPTWSKEKISAYL
ncbi:hypothetical protein [Sulfurihydrogenibium subterraneum]|uniref:hypothetical protein n=1 Tax=Sulfurihydrogenibium subterraneum TaxID=171121 RepID=UPI000AC8C84C|nr:hypothetical protein [Sulfurihydrogenibium subterraneum]